MNTSTETSLKSRYDLEMDLLKEGGPALRPHYIFEKLSLVSDDELRKIIKNADTTEEVRNSHNRELGLRHQYSASLIFFRFMHSLSSEELNKLLENYKIISAKINKETDYICEDLELLKLVLDYHLLLEENGRNLDVALLEEIACAISSGFDKHRDFRNKFGHKMGEHLVLIAKDIMHECKY